MKLYTISTFDYSGQYYSNWFYATSKLEAERLIDVAIIKVKEAISKMKRVEELDKILWKNYEDLDKEYGIENYNLSIVKLMYPDKYKEYQLKRENLRKQIQNGLAWKLLSKIKYQYETLANNEEIILENVNDLKNRIIEIETNQILIK